MAGESFEEGRAHGGRADWASPGLELHVGQGGDQTCDFSQLANSHCSHSEPSCGFDDLDFPIFLPEIHCEGKSPDGHILYFVTVGS